MASPADLLHGWAEQIDPSAFALAVSDGELSDARSDFPQLAALPDDSLRDLLGAAALNGVSRFLGGATLALDVHGPGPDPSADALEAVMRAIRSTAHLLRATPSSDDEARLQLDGALQILDSLLEAWDTAADPTPTAG